MAMRLLLFLFVSPLFAGSGLEISTVPAENQSFPPVKHGPFVLEMKLSDWANASSNDAIVLANAYGLIINYSSPTLMGITSNWETGATSNCLNIDLTQFASNYVWLRYQHDPGGVLGAAKRDYCQFYDHTCALIVNGVNPYTGEAEYSSAGIYVGHTGNAAKQRIHFVRARATSSLVALTARMPATADSGPLNSGTWDFNWKFDGSLVDSASGKYKPVMGDGSRPSGSCGSTTSSYCPTLYDGPQAIITPVVSAAGFPVWHAGSTQQLMGTSSYSQSDASPTIVSYSWTLLSGPAAITWPGGQSIANPTVVLPSTFGDYAFQLTVTDGSGAMSTATKHVGAVVTDANDIVVFPARYDWANTIIGPQMLLGSALNPFGSVYDQTQVNEALYRGRDFLTLNGGAAASPNQSVAYFQAAKSGTASIPNGSRTLTGSDTVFLTELCATGSATAFAQAINTTAGPFAITAGLNDKLLISFDGRDAATVTLRPGAARTVKDIVADINAVIGGDSATNCGSAKVGTHAAACVTYNGALFTIQTATMGRGSVSLQAIANSAYATLGLNQQTWTVAHTPQSNFQVVVWYPTGSPAPFNLGHRAMNLLGCVSNTVAVVEQVNGLSWQLPTQTRVNFSADDRWATFGYYNNPPLNYYDLTGFLGLWLRTGLDEYKDLWRNSELRWFLSPFIDQGQEMQRTTGNAGNSGNAFDTRRIQLAGIIALALDAYPNVAAGMWPGIRKIEALYRYSISDPGGHDRTYGMGIDQRAYAYYQQGYGLCSLFDPNELGDADLCRAAIANSLTYVSTPQRDATGNWPTYQLSESSGNDPNNPTPTANNRGATVCVQKGSNLATINPGHTFLPVNGATYGSSPFPSYIWFFPANASLPATNAGGDPVAYPIASINGAKTQITLGSNYAGTTKCTGVSGNNAGYAATDLNGLNPSYVGLGSQPMFIGLLGLGFAFEAQAMRCTSPGMPKNCDNTKAALLQSYTIDTANWLMKVGSNSASQGFYQGAAFINCPAPIVATLCFASSDEGERILAFEGSGAVNWAWKFTGTTAFKTLMDGIFSNAWSKTSQMPNYQPGQTYMMSSLAAAKYHGQAFGISALASWLAARNCTTFVTPCLTPVGAGGVRIASTSSHSGESLEVGVR